MSRTDALPGGVRESLHVIGWFPSGLDPTIPEIVLAERAGREFVCARDLAERECAPELRQQAVRIDIVLSPGQWIVVEGEPRAMLWADISSWRDQAATRLVQEAMQLKGDPLRVFKMLESAASLRNLNLGNIVSTLRTQRAAEDESLGSVFLRVRGSQAGGRTGG